MAEDDSDRLKRAAKLTETLRELQAKTYEVTEELRKILVGEVSVGDNMREVSDYWLEQWAARYGSKYAWLGVKDSAPAKRLLKDFTVAEIQSRALRFLKDGDPFYVKARHPFALFASNINRYAPERPADLELSAPVIGCHHDPPCSTDQEHTKRRNQEMRA